MKETSARNFPIVMEAQSSEERVACLEAQRKRIFSVIELNVKMVKREVSGAWVKPISSLRNKAVDMNILYSNV